MEPRRLSRFVWRVKSSWDPSEGMALVSGEKDALGTQPEGKPLKHVTRRKPQAGRGGPKPALKLIPEFYHRGDYERHEIRPRRIPKAALRFRGKGSKTERRHGPRVKK